MLPLTCQNHQKSHQTTSVGEDVEKRKASCTVDRNVNWCSFYGQQSLLGTYPNEEKTLTWKDTGTPKFMAALFTIVKEVMQVSIKGWMIKENVAYTYNGIWSSHKKEWNLAICDNMDGPWEHFAKLNKDKYHVITLRSRIYNKTF